MMKHIRASFLFTLFYIYPAYAVTFDSNSLSDLFEQSSVVGYVYIDSGSVWNIKHKGNSVQCGYIYNATVIDIFKGSINKFVFGSALQLTLGSKNLLFLSTEYLDIDMHYEDKDVSASCINEGPGLYTGWWQGGIFEETSITTFIGDDSKDATVNEYETAYYFRHASDHTYVENVDSIKVDVDIPESYKDFISIFDINFEIYDKSQFLTIMYDLKNNNE